MINDHGRAEEYDNAAGLLGLPRRREPMKKRSAISNPKTATPRNPDHNFSSPVSNSSTRDTLRRSLLSINADCRGLGRYARPAPASAVH